MNPRVQVSKYQKRRPAPRIPFLLFQSDLFFEALTKRDFFFDQSFFIADIGLRISALIPKRDFLFDQSFFITHSSRLASLLRVVVFKKKALKEFFPQLLFSNIGY